MCYKRSIRVVLILLTILLFASCSAEDGCKYHCYLLELQFISADGENLVEGMPISSGGEISHREYELSVNGAPVTFTYMGAPLQLKGEGSGSRLQWCVTPENLPEDMEITLSCPYIFGNREIHTIDTHWAFTDKIIPECDRLTFDGVEQTLFTPDIANAFIKGVKITVSPDK